MSIMQEERVGDLKRHLDLWLEMEVTCKDLLIKTLWSKLSWRGLTAWKQARLPARPPASHRGHFQACVFSAFLPQQLRAQSRREQANESVSLCLAPNTAGTQQAQSLVGFAWVKITRIEAMWGSLGSLPNHTMQKEKQDNARMDAFKCREAGC